MREASPTDTTSLRWNWHVSGLKWEPETFVLYRIVGNDLYPRHKKGQARENVRFILENEPDFPNCEKRWVLNRIVEPQEERAIIGLLEAHGQAWLRIAFDPEEYRRVGWDTDVMPEPAYPAKVIGTLSAEQEKRMVTMAHRLKNNYVMNNNGARNAALRDGKTRAKWVLPWDGNCFVTAQAWNEIRASVAKQPWMTHFVVPMARLRDNADLTRADFVPEPVEEPQLIFRRDTRAEFNEEFGYGRRPKVEMLWRLGVPGDWDQWNEDPWDLLRGQLSDEARQFGVAGWVARLFSGVAHLEEATTTSFIQRGRVRDTAITAILANLYRQVANLDGEGRPQPLSFYDHEALDVLRTALAEDPDSDAAALARVIVADAESAMCGEEFRGLESGRIPLQGMLGMITALGLAWQLTGREGFAAIAATNMRQWFVEAGDGVVHSADVADDGGIWFALDAVRMLETSPKLTDEVRAGLQAWLERRLEWLLTGDAGRRECAVADSRGLCFDLQVSGIASYLGLDPELREAMIRAQSRLRQHFRWDGFQPQEMRKPQTADCCYRNLQGWLCLVRLGTRHAALAPDWNAEPWSLLRQAALSTLLHDPQSWPYPQEGAFDVDRAVPLAAIARDLGVLSRVEAGAILSRCDRAAIKPRFDPDYGIPPYWNAGVAVAT